MFVLRDVSLIILALEGAFLTLMVVGVLAAINYGLIRLRWWHILPHYFAIAREYLAMGQRIVEQICQAIVAPVFAIARFQARLTGMIRELPGGGKHSE